MLRKKNWNVERRIGQSERENVRADLIQIGCIDDTDLLIQIKGACKAAERLKIRGRIFFNSGKIRLHDPVYFDYLCMNGMANFRNHDLMVDVSYDENGFNRIINNSDLLILPLDSPHEIETLANQIIETWVATGGRGGILHGYGSTGNDEEKYPEYFKNIDTYRKLFFK